MTASCLRRIAKELSDMQRDAESNILAEPANGNDVTHLLASFPGPPDTPYEGGTYIVDVKIPENYPFKPPVMYFKTKLWHPNVSSQTVGEPHSSLDFSYSLIPGRHLSRYSRLSLVSRSDDQIRPSFSSISPQHTGTQRSPRRGSGKYAHEPS